MNIGWAAIVIGPFLGYALIVFAANPYFSVAIAAVIALCIVLAILRWASRTEQSTEVITGTSIEGITFRVKENRALKYDD